MNFFCWVGPRLKQYCWQQQEILLNHWPGHCLGHRNNFSKINWNSWQLIKITAWNFYLVNLWSWFEPKDLKLSRACDFLSAFSVPGTCANPDELGCTDSTKTVYGINFDVSFTLHNILSFKSIEDKQRTSLSWQTIKSLTKTWHKATFTYICLPVAYLVHCFQWCLHRWHAI